MENDKERREEKGSKEGTTSRRSVRLRKALKLKVPGVLKKPMPIRRRFLNATRAGATKGCVQAEFPREREREREGRAGGYTLAQVRHGRGFTRYTVHNRVYYAEKSPTRFSHENIMMACNPGERGMRLDSGDHG